MTKQKIRNHLKKYTDEIHQRIHHHKLMVCLNPGQSIQKKDYIKALKGFYLFYQNLLHCFSSSKILSQEIKKYLQKIILDINLMEEPIAQELILKQEKYFLTHSEEMGVLYVIKGSQLGAKHIHKHLIKKLGIKEETSFNFFHYLANLNNWNSFLKTLELSVDDVDKCSEIAKKVFIFFEESLNQVTNVSEKLG